MSIPLSLNVGRNLVRLQRLSPSLPAKSTVCSWVAALQPLEHYVIRLVVAKASILNEPPQDPQVVQVLRFWVLLHLSLQVLGLSHLQRSLPNSSQVLEH